MIEQIPCSIKLLRTPRTEAGFYDFEEFERLVVATAKDPQAQLVVLLGGEAGLRCGEMIGLEWKDVDVEKRQLCVARSEWCGHVGAPKRWAHPLPPHDKSALSRVEECAPPTRSESAQR